MTPYLGQGSTLARGFASPNPLLLPGSSDVAPMTLREASAILTLRSHGGFVYCGKTQHEVFLRRFTGDWVDLGTLVISGLDKCSGVMRYERRTFPWPKKETPELLAIASGSIEDVVRQVMEWPRT